MIISVPTLPVATWNTRTGLVTLMQISLSVLGLETGPQFGGAAATPVGVELPGPLADGGEPLVLAARQCGRVGVALVLPDVDVLGELANDLARELLRLLLRPPGSEFGVRPMYTLNRTSEVSSSTGVTAVIVRLSTMPQLLVTATPRPPLIASTPLLTSSMDCPSSPSKVMVKST